MGGKETKDVPETKGDGNTGESSRAGGKAGGMAGGTGGGRVGDNKGDHSLSTISVVQHSTPDTDTRHVAANRAPYDPAEDELLLITMADLCYNTTRGT